MKIVAVALAAIFSLATAAQAATPPTAAEAAATKAMMSYQKAHGETDIESPACRVVQNWAMCGYAVGQGEGHHTVFMKQSGGAWKFVHQGGGVYTASDLESLLNMPVSVAQQLGAPPHS